MSIHISLKALIKFILRYIDMYFDVVISGSGRGVLIPHFGFFLARIPHLTFFSYQYPASHAQFWRILLFRNSQMPNPTPFFSDIPDPENTLPDPFICYW